jgi:hypothetical protein
MTNLLQPYLKRGNYCNYMIVQEKAHCRLYVSRVVAILYKVWLCGYNEFFTTAYSSRMGALGAVTESVFGGHETGVRK